MTERNLISIPHPAGHPPHPTPHVHHPTTSPHTSKPLSCTSSPPLPAVALLHEIHIRQSLPPPHRRPHIVRQRPRPTHADAHGPDLGLALQAHEGIDVRPPGEHLHGGAGGVDLLGGAGPGDEELDAQHVAALVEREDGGHPGADPLEVLGGLDDPHERHAAGGNGAIGEAGDQVADVAHLVGDADAAGKDEHGAVGAQRVQPTVGAFDQRGHGEAALSFLGSLVQRVSEAVAAADDGRDGGVLQREDVLPVHGEAFFRVEPLFGVRPGGGEGVRGPEADGGEGEEHVLPWLVVPGAGHFDGDADGVPGERLDDGDGAAATGVAVYHKS